MAIQKTQAIVLKKMDFRDTSFIVTLFTRDFGKLKAVVKGIRKEGSGDLVHFEILNHLNIVFYEKARTELHLLSESFLEDPMLDLRNSFKTFTFGCFLAELVEAFYEVHEVATGIFDALLDTLKHLEPETAPYRVFKFEMAVLKDLGLFPALTHCIRCRKTGETNWFWSTRQGGVLCAACAMKEPKAYPLLPEMYLALQNFSEGFKENGLDPMPYSLAVYTEVERIIREFILARVDHSMRSLEFLSSSDSFRFRHTLKAAEPA